MTKDDETEISIYAYIGDLEGLKQAKSYEDQIQLEATYKKGIRARVRKTSVNNKDVKYTYTMKVSNGTVGGVKSNTEYNLPVDPDFFEGFKQAAEKMLIKKRYIFESEQVNIKLHPGAGLEPIQVSAPNIKYEVDVYTRPDGTISNWCKIDVELDDLLEHYKHEIPSGQIPNFTIKVSHLPFRPSQCMLGSSKDPTVKEKLGFIWGHEWNHRLE